MIRITLTDEQVELMRAASAAGRLDVTFTMTPDQFALVDAPEPAPLPAPESVLYDRACLDQWPGCISGGYDPRCCRFPKSCSCTTGMGDRAVTFEQWCKDNPDRANEDW